MTGRITRVLRGGAPSELLPLDEAEQRLRPFSRRYLGVRSIPLDHVVGTDSRRQDFDREFQPRRGEVRSRWQRVARAFPDGDFPTIVVHKLGDAYFVIDGHHRVAVARSRGMETIDAEVTELRARWQLGPDADIVELMHAEQHRIFMEESGLAEVAPDACFQFSRPTGWGQLLENVHSHGYRLMREQGRFLEAREVAADWYDREYLGALEMFQREGLEPIATPGDLFLCVHERRRELLPACSCTTLEDAARNVVAGDATRRSFRPLSLRRGGREAEPAQRCL
jgi:ParB-like nuclease family protein